VKSSKIRNTTVGKVSLAILIVWNATQVKPITSVSAVIITEGKSKAVFIEVDIGKVRSQTTS